MSKKHLSIFEVGFWYDSNYINNQLEVMVHKRSDGTPQKNSKAVPLLVRPHVFGDKVSEGAHVTWFYTVARLG